MPAEVRRWEDLGPDDFDAVLCVGSSIAHARDRRAALARMAGALRPGGLLIVTSRRWEAERSRTERVGAVTRRFDLEARPAVMTVAVGGVRRAARGVAVHAARSCWRTCAPPAWSRRRPSEAAGRYLCTARTSRRIVDPPDCSVTR